MNNESYKIIERTVSQTVYHVWPVRTHGVQRGDEKRFCSYLGTSPDRACRVIDDIINRRRLPAGLAAIRGNGTVVMALFELPRAPRVAAGKVVAS